MGYEIAEQFRWTLPDAILYPTGGGVGLIGMWKAFDELEQLGWIGRAAAQDDRRPGRRLRAAGSRVRAGRRADRVLAQRRNRLAAACACPKPLGDFLILRAVRASAGTCIAIPDREALEAGVEAARLDGVFPAPEGAACFAAVRRLLRSGFLQPSERIVIYNTGTGLKYIEAYSTLFPRTIESEANKLGGLITPR